VSRYIRAAGAQFLEGPVFFAGSHNATGNLIVLLRPTYSDISPENIRRPEIVDQTLSRGFHRRRPFPGGNTLFISPNRFPEKLLAEKCSPELAMRAPLPAAATRAFSNPDRLPQA
jgi:hypothetical protein